MKKIILIVLLLTVILTSCAKKETEKLNFCQSLSRCEKADTEIKDSKTNDIYSLSILGIKDNFCAIELSAEEISTEKIKSFEKLSATCTQEWNSKFEKIANFDESTCKKYVDSIMINLMNEIADKKSTICSGELRNKLLRK